MERKDELTSNLGGWSASCIKQQLDLTENPVLTTIWSDNAKIAIERRALAQQSFQLVLRTTIVGMYSPIEFFIRWRNRTGIQS